MTPTYNSIEEYLIDFLTKKFVSYSSSLKIIEMTPQLESIIQNKPTAFIYTEETDYSEDNIYKLNKFATVKFQMLYGVKSTEKKLIKDLYKTAHLIQFVLSNINWNTCPNDVVGTIDDNFRVSITDFLLKQKRIAPDLQNAMGFGMINFEIKIQIN